MTDLEPLLRGATDDDPRVRQEAAIALGTADPTPVIDRLVSIMIGEPDDYVRETLIWAIVARGTAAVPALVASLDDPLNERERILHTLSKIGDPATVPAIIPHAADPDRVVAAKAWWALGRIGTPESLPVLLAHLGEGDADRRLGLTRALLQFGPDGVCALVEALGGGTPAASEHAAEVLVRLADPTQYGIAQRGADTPAREAVIAATAPEVDLVLRALAADGDDPASDIAAELLAARR
ncbi:HEAT repeat domain-containing protein [Mariniluteicoccus endophyticus]